MFHNILVAIDNSESSQQNFEEALLLAKAIKAQLMLLHVLSQDEEDYPNSLSYYSYYSVDYYPPITDELWKNYQQQWEAYEQKGLTVLSEHVAKAKMEGVNAQFMQTVGNPGRSICQLADDWGADLIVVGRRGRSGLSEILLGSVSNYVVHHAPCSVLTVQKMWSKPVGDREDKGSMSGKARRALM